MKYLLLTLSLLILTSDTTAQIVKYNDGKIMYQDEELQTINVTLSPKVETIKDKFESWMSDHYNVNLDGKKLLFFDKEFMTANGVIIPKISQRQIDLKVKVNESKNGNTQLHVFASYGYNNWITPEDHPQAYRSLRGIVYDFVGEYLPEYYYDKIQKTQDQLKDLTDQNIEFREDILNKEKDIVKLKNEIDELEKDIKSNESLIKKEKEKLRNEKKDYDKITERVSNMN